ncbi:MAG: hypothetical protein K2P84_08520 [Undibacterium sp.]|nr:hypothetical protein [Undibacterium sp.]
MVGNESSTSNEHRSGGREDAGLPLKARIGSVVQLQKSPLIRAQTQGSLVEMPDENETLICAISRLKTDLRGDLYRYYLNVGDDSGSQTQSEKFLQLYLDEHGGLNEILYCSRLTRFIPESVEDQDAFLGEAGYGLGDATYTLWRDQIADLGLDESSLQAAFGDQDSIVYQRDAGDVGQEFIAPFRGVENRIDNAAGSLGLKQELVFMPYSRKLVGDQSEILLISTEIVESANGDRNQRGIHVDFMIGIVIENDRLVVQ